MLGNIAGKLAVFKYFSREMLDKFKEYGDKLKPELERLYCDEMREFDFKVDEKNVADAKNI